MTDVEQARRIVTTRILDGEGAASHAQRFAAFENQGLTGPLAALIEKVTQHADRVTDADIEAVRAVGRTEDEIFELVICAAVGEASRQHDAAMAALDAATLPRPRTV